MEQLFKDWGSFIIGIMAIIISILTSFYIYFRQRKYKKLSYEIIVNYSLFDIKEDIKEKVTITYSGKRAENLRLVSLKILNTGKLPILKSDFENNIQIVFDKYARLIDAEIYEMYPINLDARIEIEQTLISLMPCLINPNDFIIFKIILDSSESNFNVLSRIAGVDSIKQISTKEYKTFSTTIVVNYSSFTLVWLMFLVYAYVSELSFKNDGSSIQFTIFIILFSVSIISTALIILYFIKINSKGSEK